MIVGFVGIAPSRDPIDPTLGEVDTIAVDPSQWHQWIGRELMSVALAHLLKDAYREAVVWTLANYERGRIFYERTGCFLDGRDRTNAQQVLYRHFLSNVSLWPTPPWVLSPWWI
jgi:ribosomal protein S18 acetylase RimI-like enzyme